MSAGCWGYWQLDGRRRMGEITAGREKSNGQGKRCRTLTRTVLTRNSWSCRGMRVMEKRRLMGRERWEEIWKRVSKSWKLEEEREASLSQNQTPEPASKLVLPAEEHSKAGRRVAKRPVPRRGGQPVRLSRRSFNIRSIVIDSFYLWHPNFEVLEVSEIGYDPLITFFLTGFPMPEQECEIDMIGKYGTL